MKISTSEQSLSLLNPAIAAYVRAWKLKHKRRDFSVEFRPRAYIEEDANCTAFNLETGATASARASGEWAGHTNFPCGQEIPIPLYGAIAQSGWFLGKAYLSITVNEPTPHAHNLAFHAGLALQPA